MQIVKILTSEALPVPLEDVQLDLRVDSEDDADTVERLIRAAGSFLEIRTGWSVIPGNYTALLSEWPCGPLEIYRAPLRELESIEYLSDVDTWTEVDVAEFQLSRRKKSFVISPLSTFIAPTLFTCLDSVRINFAAGFDAGDSAFGDGSYPIEDGMRTLLTMFVAEGYKNRELGSAMLENRWSAMLAAYRTFW